MIRKLSDAEFKEIALEEEAKKDYWNRNFSEKHIKDRVEILKSQDLWI